MAYAETRGQILLGTTDEQFDVTTFAPIHPWMGCATSLHSIEYHEVVRARLRPGSVVAQLVPLYETEEADRSRRLCSRFERRRHETARWCMGSGYSSTSVRSP